jgi:AcrR family transcriptional regulator
VEAAGRLLAEGKQPTISDVAEAAEVSRRTVYMYFPTLDALLVTGALFSSTRDTIDAVLDRLDADGVEDVEIRVVTLVRAMQRHAESTEAQGRMLMRLAAESGDERPAGQPRRGFRRVEWIERALAPARRHLPRGRYNRLVSALCLVVGWEPFIVLRDIRGATPAAAEEISVIAARAVVHEFLG